MVKKEKNAVKLAILKKSVENNYSLPPPPLLVKIPERMTNNMLLFNCFILLTIPLVNQYLAFM